MKTSCKEPVFNPEHDFENIEIDVRQLFPNAKVFEKAVTEMSIQQSRRVKLIKNDKRRVRYVCKYDIKCPWYVYASVMDDEIGFQVRTMNKTHNCPVSFTNKQVTAKWCASKYQEKWKNQPNWNITSFAKQLRDDTCVDVSRWTFYRARRFASRALRGDAKE